MAREGGKGGKVVEVRVAGEERGWHTSRKAAGKCRSLGSI